MMQSEFEAMVAKHLKTPNFRITPESYAEIECVYMNHPIIKDVGGKEQIVQFYLNGLIYDMLPAAEKVQRLEEEHRALLTEDRAEQEEFERAVAKLTADRDIKRTRRATAATDIANELIVLQNRYSRR